MLKERGVGIRCLDQGDLDTTTPTGDLIGKIMAALAEWEAAITRERTVEGLAAARERRGGKLPVRGSSISSDKIATARHLASQGMSAARIAEIVGVSRATLYRHVDLTAAREAHQAPEPRSTSQKAPMTGRGFLLSALSEIRTHRELVKQVVDPGVASWLCRGAVSRRCPDPYPGSPEPG